MLSTLSLIFCLASGDSCVERQVTLENMLCMNQATAQATALAMQQADPVLAHRTLARWGCTPGGRRESL